MKKIGIVGGLSPESTILYYKHIINKYYELMKNYDFPEILIYSISFEKFSSSMKENRGKAIEEILKALHALKKAGADFAIISANTPHIFFDDIKKKAGLPLISIIDATIKKAKEFNLKNLLLLGTLFTMNSKNFKESFEKSGIKIIVPSDDEKNTINEIIFKELAKGLIKEESKEKIIKIIKKYEVDGVILGCTELPLILSQKDIDMKLLDTAAIHAEEALTYAMNPFFKKESVSSQRKLSTKL